MLVDDPFTEDLLLYDVPFVPTAVLSVTFLSLDADFVSDFSTDWLFVIVTVLFLISLVFDWLIDDLLVFSFSFWSLPDVLPGDEDFGSTNENLL